MNNFSGSLLIQYDHAASEILGGDYWRLMRSFRYYLPTSLLVPDWTVGNRKRWAFAPAGMLTDLGSIPKVFRGIISNGGAASQAYVLHDQLCEYLSITNNGYPEKITREECDLILKAALLDLQIDNTTAHLIYNAVAAYQFVRQVRDPSTTRIKRDLEAAFNYEDLL
jgi:hypothetical protein